MRGSADPCDAADSVFSDARGIGFVCIDVQGQGGWLADPNHDPLQYQRADACQADGEFLAVRDPQPLRVPMRGMQVALNPAPMDGRVGTLPLELVDVLIVNAIEGAELLKLRGAEAPEAPTAALEALHGLFPEAQIVMTLGENGVAAVDADGAVSQTAAFRVQAVDTTAAGDTFAGFFLASRARGAGMAAALRLASAAAAIGVTRPGASPSVPSIREVEAWLAARDGERTCNEH